MNKTISLVIILILIVFIWFITSILLNQNFILPGPEKVFISIILNLKKHIMNTGITLIESFIGIGLSVIISVLLLSIVAFSKKYESIIYTLGIFFKAAPAVAYAPIIIVFFGNNLFSKALVSSMISFFPILNGGIDGIRNTPEKITLLSKIYSGKNIAIFRHIQIGYCISGFLSGLKTAAPLSVVGAIVGEYVSGGTPTGLGTFIFSSYANLQMSDVFAGVLITTFIGLLFFYIVTVIAGVTNAVLHLIK